MANFWKTIGSGLENFWNKITGSGLTGAEREANEWSARQAELAFEREADFYEKNQSIKAQISAQREAGINPFGINGSASAGPVVSSSAPSSVAPTGSQGFDPIALAMQIAKFKLDKQITEAQIGKTKAETKNIETDTEWKPVLNSQQISESLSRIKSNEAQFNKSMQDIEESKSRIDVNNSTLEVNGSRITLMGSQTDLNETQKVINKLDAKKAELLQPYIQARAEAEIAYTSAKTDEARKSAEKQMYDANMSMLGVMREADLIDKGYYDHIVKQAEYGANNEERSYHWKPINDVVSNTCNIVVAGASAYGSLSGAGLFAPVRTKIGF